MTDQVEQTTISKEKKGKHDAERMLYRILFRSTGQAFSCYSKITNLVLDEIVMIQTDHGLEPARVFKKAINLPESVPAQKKYYTAVRRASRDEIDKYKNLVVREKEATVLCNQLIEELGLKMKLISVERYFNGSKILFYFTADNRVDFRELVKKLVQEFRTRVEMKQIGVRHETKMLGGLGCCGRELCCSSFIGKFAPVSIKMAKEQDLPLNPLKISGLCNRLLCCLTHEYSTYKTLRKNMPRQGRYFTLNGKRYKVLQVNVLNQTIKVFCDEDDSPEILTDHEWEQAVFESKPARVSKGGKQGLTKKDRPKKKKEPRKQEGKKKHEKGKSRPPKKGKVVSKNDDKSSKS